MAFSWENMKQNVKDNSPNGENVGKVLAVTVFAYASVLIYHHSDSISNWATDKWGQFTRKKEYDSEKEE